MCVCVCVCVCVFCGRRLFYEFSSHCIHLGLKERMKMKKTPVMMKLGTQLMILTSASLPVLLLTPRMRLTLPILQKEFEAFGNSKYSVLMLRVC